MAKARSIFTAPWYPWYVRDVLTSERVDLLSLAEEGAYRRALDKAWMVGSVPADPKDLAVVIGSKCTVKIAERVLTMFVPMPNNPGRMVNQKLETIRKEQREKYQKKSKTGKENIAKRWKKKTLDDSNAIATVYQPDSIQNQNQNLLKEDFKRLIETCVREHPTIDPRIVEIGVIHTMIQRNGSTAPINSVRYFDAEIKKTHQGAMGLTAGGKPGKNLSPMTTSAIDMMLKSRRARYEKHVGERCPKQNPPHRDSGAD